MIIIIVIVPEVSAYHLAWPSISWTLPLRSLRPLLVKRGDFSLVIGDQPRLSEPKYFELHRELAEEYDGPPRSHFPNLAYILMARGARGLASQRASSERRRCRRCQS